MVEEVARVLIDAIGARALQLFLAVTAGEQADGEGAGAASGERSQTLSPTTTQS
jgi:hypothetical protein